MGITTDGHWPCVYTLCLPDVSALDQISQCFPLCICIMQTIKYWRWEWLGNETICLFFSHLQDFKIVLLDVCTLLTAVEVCWWMLQVSAVNILDNDVDCTYFTTHFSIHHQTTIHYELVVKSYWAILTSLITDVFCCTCTFHFGLKPLPVVTNGMTCFFSTAIAIVTAKQIALTKVGMVTM